MDTNIGTVDQLIRIVVLILSAFFYLTHRGEGFTSTASGVLVIYCFITALTRYSPVWDLFGISTEKPGEKKP